MIATAREIPTQLRRRYVQTSFSCEACLFSVVEANRDSLFGAEAAWVPRAFLFERGAAGDFPDAFVFDLEEGAWGPVQVELGRSPLWSDLVPRVSRRLTHLQHPMFRLWLAEMALAVLQASPAAGDPARIGRLLRSTVETPPRLTLVLDAVTPMLRDWCGTLRFETRLIEITRHAALEDPRDVCYRIPLQGSGASTLSSGLDPQDDALPASRFLLVRDREPEPCFPPPSWEPFPSAR